LPACCCIVPGPEPSYILFGNASQW